MGPASLLDDSVVLALQEEPTRITSGAGYGILCGALVSVCLVAVLWPYFTQHHKEGEAKKLAVGGEGYVSARNTQKWWAITASFFSSSMGTWVLTAPADIGAAYGAWGVIGYALATGVPWAFLAIFGPMMRERTQHRGFTQADYLRKRFGFGVHLLFVGIAVGTMFVALIVEAVTLGSIYLTVSPQMKDYVVIIFTGFVVLVYTMLSGIRATLLTDRLQFIVLSLLIIVGFSGMMAEIRPKIKAETFKQVGGFKVDGFVTLLVLNISCLFPVFMDPSAWGRMYAAESPREARKGLLVAAAALVVPMTFFGMSGVVAQAAIQDGVAAKSASTFFSLIAVLKQQWSVLLLILATCLSVSTIDTFCNGFSMVIASELAPLSRKPININYCRIGSFLIFVAAMGVSIRNPPSVMTLFMIGNLLSACAAPAVLWSLSPEVSGIGAVAGVAAGALSVMIYGWARVHTFVGGFSWWLLPEGSTGIQALWTFLATAVVSSVVPIAVSKVEFWLNPESKELQAERLRDLARVVIGADAAGAECAGDTNAAPRLVAAELKSPC